MAKKILLADDSLTIQKVVQITFARQDVELTMVDNGDDALARLGEGGADIVLADVMMPGKDGYQLCQAIKTNPATQSTPVLLLAGAYEPFDEAKARACGANGHILKPFESQQLIQRVEELLAGGGAPAAAPQPAAPQPAAAQPAVPQPAAPQPAAPAPQPAAPAATPLAAAAPAAPPAQPAAPAEVEVDLGGGDAWDLSEEPAAPAAPAAAAPPPPPPPPAPEPEFEVAMDDGGDAWDLSEEPAAPAAPQPPAAAAPPPPPPPAPEPEVEVDVAGGDAWDLSEEPAAPAAPAAPPAPEPVLEPAEPTLEPAPAESFGEVETEVEVAMDDGGDDGDVWDLAEDQPTDLSAAAAPVQPTAPAEVETEVTDDSWDLSEETAEPATVAEPEPVMPPPPPPPAPAATPTPEPVAPAVAAMDTGALEAAVRQALEARLPDLLGEVANVVAEEVRKQVPRIAEELISREIEKLKA